MSENPTNFQEQLPEDQDQPGGVDSGEAEGADLAEQYAANTEAAEKEILGDDREG